MRHSEICYWDRHGKIFQQLNTEGKRKLWFHRNLVSEETTVCDSCWQGMMLCPWSQWIFCHLLQGVQDQTGGLWVLVLIHWFVRVTWWLMGNSSSGGAVQHCSFVFLTAPLLYCPSLLYLLRAAVRSPCGGCPHCLPRLVLCSAYCEPVHKSAGAVQACRAQWDNAPPGRPGGLTSAHQRDGAVDGQCTASRARCADGLSRVCSFAVVCHSFIRSCVHAFSPLFHLWLFWAKGLWKGLLMVSFNRIDQHIFQTWNWSYLINAF